MKSILSVDQKNMFYMLSETMWTHKEYPSDSNTENELWNLQDFQEAMNVEQIQLLMKHLFQQELNMFIM